MAKQSKGSAFERRFCKALSLWWSGGNDDSLFWRSSNSGGRATVRQKQGKKTTGHCGDVAATSSDGEPLLEKVVFELKRGYNASSVSNLLDVPKNSEYLKWIEQAKRSAEQSGSETWCIIHQRDRKLPIVLTTEVFYQYLCKQYKILIKESAKFTTKNGDILYAFPLHYWLKEC